MEVLNRSAIRFRKERKKEKTVVEKNYSYCCKGHAGLAQVTGRISHTGFMQEGQEDLGAIPEAEMTSLERRTMVPRESTGSYLLKKRILYLTASY